MEASLGRAPARAPGEDSPGRALRHAHQVARASLRVHPSPGGKAAGWDGPGRGRATARKDLDSQAEFGQTRFANTSPSLFKDRGAEGDKGGQNLRQSGVVAKYQTAAGLKAK